MFILIGVGMICFKKKMLTLKATRIFSNFLLNMVTPCLIIDAYNRDFNKSEAKGLLFAFILSVLFHVIAAVCTKVFIRERKDENYRIEKLGAIYSNCGFMAFPLLAAVLGKNSIFYGTAFVTVFNLFLWSNGISILSKDKKLSIKKVFINPGTIGTYIGLITYFMPIRLPEVLSDTVSYMASLNTPLAMVITGVFLANVNIKESLKKIYIYRMNLLRLIVYPIMFILILKLINVENLISNGSTIVKVVGISSACPAAASIILLASKMKLDDGYGAEAMAVSTLFSIITLPIITMFINYLF